MKRVMQQLFSEGLLKANIGIFVSNFEGKIVFSNEYMSEYLGYCAEEFLLLHVTDINQEFFKQQAFFSIKDRYITPIETFYTSKDGSRIPFEVTTSFHTIDQQDYSISYIRDIRKRKERDESLALFHDMLNDSHDMIFILRINDGYIDYANQTVLRTLGYTLEEIREIGVEKFRQPLKEGEPFYRHLQELKQTGKLTDYATLVKKDGSKIPIEANVRYVHRRGTDYNIAIVRDISDRIDTERRLEHLNLLLKNNVIKQTEKLEETVAFLKGYKLALDAGNIVSKSDLFGRITYVNDNFCLVSGFSYDEVIGKPHSIIRHPDTDMSIFESLWSTIKAKKMWQGIIKNRKKDGGYYWVDLRIVPIINQSGDVEEYIAVRHEVTKLIENQEVLEKVLTTDALTQYGNRHRLIRDIAVSQEPLLALINIDNFREINDFYGHSFGDLLIIEVAKCMDGIIRDRSSKSFYRLDGDEFAILGNTLTQEQFITKIQEIVSTIAQTLFCINDEEISIQVTASISFEASKENLFSTANLAMASAKKNQQTLLVYDDFLLLNNECENNIKWTRKLNIAIRNRKIIPYYQPIVDNLTGEYSKYEALVRLIDEDDKVVSPFFFLDIAKRTKHYPTITQRVLEQSFECFYHSNLSFSVNLTIKDIMDVETQQMIFSLLEKYKIGERVVFEIVESEGIENFESVIAFIESVKEYGCKIAIDDFGTGYSNFEYLLKLKANFIKIDGSLIKNLHKDNDAKILVSTIVSFSKQLGMKTIAEFVSDESTYHIVKEMGIDYSQGYYFGEPKSSPLTLEQAKPIK